MQMRTCFIIEVNPHFLLAAIVVHMCLCILVGHFWWLVNTRPVPLYYLHFDHAMSERIDPAVNDELCSVAAADLERARNSSGTDHDW